MSFDSGCSLTTMLECPPLPFDELLHGSSSSDVLLTGLKLGSPLTDPVMSNTTIGTTTSQDADTHSISSGVESVSG